MLIASSPRSLLLTQLTVCHNREINKYVTIYRALHSLHVMDYVPIAKGRGYVYAHENQLYRQVKKRQSVTYLKCCTDPCDGSAKIERGEFKVIVSILVLLCTLLTSPIFVTDYVRVNVCSKFVFEYYSRMTLNGVIAVILRYFAEFNSFAGQLRKSG